MGVVGGITLQPREGALERGREGVLHRIGKRLEVGAVVQFGGRKYDMETVGIERAVPAQECGRGGQTLGRDIARVFASRQRTNDNLVEGDTIAVVVRPLERQLIGGALGGQREGIRSPLRLEERVVARILAQLDPPCGSRGTVVHPQGIYIACTRRLCMREYHDRLESLFDVKDR